MHAVLCTCSKLEELMGNLGPGFFRGRGLLAVPCLRCMLEEPMEVVG